MRLAAPFAFFTLTLVLWGPLPALAGEGEQAISASAGYANLALPQTADDGSDTEIGIHGGMAQVDYERGLSDTFAIRGSLGGGVYDGPVGLAYSGAAIADVIYRFDILRYVPYFFGGLGVVTGFGDGVDTRFAPVVELGGGLEILESRDFSWGLEFKGAAFPTQARYVTIGARLSWRWGYF